MEGEIKMKELTQKQIDQIIMDNQKPKDPLITILSIIITTLIFLVIMTSLIWIILWVWFNITTFFA